MCTSNYEQLTGNRPLIPKFASRMRACSFPANRKLRNGREFSLKKNESAPTELKNKSQ